MSKQGQVWKSDSAGIILNNASLDAIQEAFKAVIDDTVQAIIDHIGDDIHSIYIAGSVARGMAIQGKSDLNVIAVLEYHVDPELVMQDWIRPTENALSNKYDVVSAVNLDLYPYGWLMRDDNEFSISAFILKTQAVCVWGSDVSPDLGDYNLFNEKVRIAIANDDIIQIQDDIDEAFAEIEGDTSAENVRYWCREVCKNIVWTGFALTMVAHPLYSRDVDIAAQYFAQAYPKQAEHIRQTLDFIAHPTDYADEILHFLETFGEWLMDECDTWIERYNPDYEYEYPLADEDEEESD